MDPLFNYVYHGFSSAGISGLFDPGTNRRLRFVVPDDAMIGLSEFMNIAPLTDRRAGYQCRRGVGIRAEVTVKIVNNPLRAYQSGTNA